MRKIVQLVGSFPHMISNPLYEAEHITVTEN